MHTIPTSQIHSDQLQEIKLIAESKASPEVRDLLLQIVSSIREGEKIVATDSDESLTPSQAAKHLGMSRTHLYKLLDRGDISYFSVGRDRRIQLHDVLAFAQKRHHDRSELAERFSRQQKSTVSADAEIADLL
ncbi:helix-turn-helix domain-containing protein [Corynebacterium sp. S7]